MAGKHEHLSRRERQIMDVIHAKGEATAADVMEGMENAPSYSAVRALLAVMEKKGLLRHREDGPRYIYMPTLAREKASRSALKKVLQTFFEGSLANAVSALVDTKDGQLAPDELKRLESIIKQARKS